MHDESNVHQSLIRRFYLWRTRTHCSQIHSEALSQNLHGHNRACCQLGQQGNSEGSDIYSKCTFCIQVPNQKKSPFILNWVGVMSSLRALWRNWNMERLRIAQEGHIPSVPTKQWASCHNWWCAKRHWTARDRPQNGWLVQILIGAKTASNSLMAGRRIGLISNSLATCGSDQLDVSRWFLLQQILLLWRW